MKQTKNLFIPFPKIETKRCILSEISEKNQDEIFKIYSNSEIMKYMQRNPILTIDEAKELIDYWNDLKDKNAGIRWGVYLKDNPTVLIGTIALQYWNKHSNSIELGADLLKDYWGQGLAFEFTKVAIDFAFENLEINRIELRCNPKNIASNTIAKKFGFTFEGTLREYVRIEGRGYDDESVYSLLKKEYLMGS